MSKTADFLRESKVYYLATSKNNIPHVRPFGALAEHEGRLYFITSNKKEVYKQLVENPFVEISSTLASGDWIRITGEAVFDREVSAIEAVLDANPALKSRYQAGDGSVAVFYLKNGKADFYSFTNPPYSETI